MTETLLFLFMLHPCLLLVSAKLQYPGLNKCYCITLKESKVQKIESLEIHYKLRKIPKCCMYEYVFMESPKHQVGSYEI
jgi:hypothetical protein